MRQGDATGVCPVRSQRLVGIAFDRIIRHKAKMSSKDAEMIVYSSPVVLVGASPVPVDAALAALPQDWPLIAADGGAAAILSCGRVPSVVIGDMDSLARDVTLPERVRTIRLSGQDDTDFEKCMARIAAPLVVCLGFLEARFDHSLAAIHALMRLDHDRPVMLIGASDVMLRLRGDFAVQLPVGSRLSIWPLGSQTFHASSGLRWPLDGLSMAPGKMVGISNQTTAATVSIAAADGDGYAVILPLTEADAVLAALASMAR